MNLTPAQPITIELQRAGAESRCYACRQVIPDRRWWMIRIGAPGYHVCTTCLRLLYALAAERVVGRRAATNPGRQEH